MSFKKEVEALVKSIKNYIDLRKRDKNIIFKLIRIESRKIENNKKVYDVNFTLSVENSYDHDILYNLVFDKELNVSVNSYLISVNSYLPGQKPDTKDFSCIDTLNKIENLVDYILEEYSVKLDQLQNSNPKQEINFSNIKFDENTGIDYSIIGNEQDLFTFNFEESDKGSVSNFIKNWQSLIKGSEEINDKSVSQSFKQIDEDIENINKDIKLNNPYLKIIRHIIIKAFKDPELKKVTIEYYRNTLRFTFDKKQVELNLELSDNFDHFVNINISGSSTRIDLDKNLDSSFDYIIFRIKRELGIKDNKENEEPLKEQPNDKIEDLKDNVKNILEENKNSNEDCGNNLELQTYDYLSNELLFIIGLLNKRLSIEKEFQLTRCVLIKKIEDNSVILSYIHNNESLELCVIKIEDLISISICKLKTRRLFSYKTLDKNKFDCIVDIFKEYFNKKVENKDVTNQEPKPIEEILKDSFEKMLSAIEKVYGVKSLFINTPYTNSIMEQFFDRDIRHTPSLSSHINRNKDSIIPINPLSILREDIERDMKLTSCCKSIEPKINNNLFLPLKFKSQEEYDYYMSNFLSFYRNGTFGSKGIKNDYYNNTETYKLLNEQADVIVPIIKKGLSKKNTKKLIKKLEKFIKKFLNKNK